MGKKVVVFMLVLAIMVACFGNGIAEDFFTTTGEAFYTFARMTDTISDGIRYVFVGTDFEPEDTVTVARYYFDDGHYCDVAVRVTENYWSNRFNLFHFVYSTNQKVTRYSAFRLADIFTMANSFCNAQGKPIYKVYWWTGHFEITTTYYEYCLNYQRNSSTDGWFEQTGLEDLL